VARLVRLRSGQRDARPAGKVDCLIRQIQERQRSATPTKQRATIRKEETVIGSDNVGGEAGSARRRKKRGSGGHNKTQEVVAPPHLHLMYREEHKDAPSREGEDEESDAYDV